MRTVCAYEMRATTSRGAIHPVQVWDGAPFVNRPMTLEQRERFKQAEAAEKLKQQEVRARHDTDRIYNTDPYEETPAEETVDKLANKPSLGIMSVLIRVVLFILIACAFVAFRSGKPGRVATVAGLHVPLNLKVHGDYQHLLGAGRDSPGVVAVYLHHDMNSASDWSGLAPFADDAPNAVPCGMSEHTTRLGSATAHHPTSEDCAPGRWAAPSLERCAWAAQTRG